MMASILSKLSSHVSIPDFKRLNVSISIAVMHILCLLFGFLVFLNWCGEGKPFCLVFHFCIESAPWSFWCASLAGLYYLLITLSRLTLVPQVYLWPKELGQILILSLVPNVEYFLSSIPF